MITWTPRVVVVMVKNGSLTDIRYYLSASKSLLTVTQCWCPRGKFLSLRILKDQFTSPCPSTTSSCPFKLLYCPCGIVVLCLLFWCGLNWAIRLARVATVNPVIAPSIDRNLRPVANDVEMCCRTRDGFFGCLRDAITPNCTAEAADVYITAMQKMRGDRCPTTTGKFKRLQVDPSAAATSRRAEFFFTLAEY